jgi:tetratricopeptide (TPR) repeat protein
MQRSHIVPALVLALVAPLAGAVPDATGEVSSAPAPNLSADTAMSARLNYNLGYERFQKTQQLEATGAALKGAKARDHQNAVMEGYAEARERFRTAASADANMKEAWNLLGYTSRRLGDYEESLTAYDKALALQPDYPEAIEYRAELFLLTGRLAQVKEAYAVLSKSSPSYAGVLKQSMQDWLAQKKPAAAVSDSERSAFTAWVATL